MTTAKTARTSSQDKVMQDMSMYDAVEQVAREAGDIALGHFRRLASVPVESKGHLDLVTEADQQVERFIAQRLQSLFPSDGLFGEEGASAAGDGDRIWVIDPIDGTFNFVRGGDQWAISIGLYQNGRPEFGVIHAPVRAQTIRGGRSLAPTVNGRPLLPRPPFDRARAATGVGFHPVIPAKDRLAILRFIFEEARMSFRCCGSATISLLEVAFGQVDGYIGVGESTWDVVAAFAILEQIGVRSTVDWSAIDLSDKLKFACGGPEFLRLVAPVMPDGSVLRL